MRKKVDCVIACLNNILKSTDARKSTGVPRSKRKSLKVNERLSVNFAVLGVCQSQEE